MSHTITKLKNLENFTLHPSLHNLVQSILPRIHSGKFVELFVEHENNVIHGMGISWANAAHPTAKYIQFRTLVESSRLLDSLLTTASPFNKIIAFYASDDLAEINMLENHGFRLFRKTYEENYRIVGLIRQLKTKAAVPFMIPLKDALDDSQIEKELFLLLKEIYEQTHSLNEAKDVPWQIWRNRLLEDDPDVQVSKVILQNNRVAGYSFIHPIDENHCEVGWLGKTGNIDLFPVLKTQLLELKEMGLLTVGFEVDTTDHIAYELAELLELEQKASWNSYMLKSTELN